MKKAGQVAILLLKGVTDILICLHGVFYDATKPTQPMALHIITLLSQSWASVLVPLHFSPLIYPGKPLPAD